MKRDLERLGEKMTPEEERQVWSRMRDELRGRERGEGRHPVAWLGRLSLAVGMAVLAFAIWRGGQGPQTPGDWVPSPDHQPPVFATEGGKPAGTRMEDDEYLTREKKLPGTEAEGVDGVVTYEATRAPSETPETAAAPSRVASPDMGKLKAGEDRASARKAPPRGKTNAQDLPYPTEPSMVVLEDKKRDAQEADVSLASPEASLEAEDLDVAESIDEIPTAAKVSSRIGSSGVPPPSDTLRRMAIQFLPGSGPGEIRGRISNEVTGDPVAYAQIVVLGTPKGAMVLEDGTFEIKNVPEGTYDLKVMMMGYEEAVLPSVTVKHDEVVDVAIALQESVAEDDRIADGIRARESSVRTIGDLTTHEPRESEEIDETKAFSEEAVEEGQLHVRGGRGEEAYYQVDGAEALDSRDDELRESMKQDVALHHGSLVIRWVGVIDNNEDAGPHEPSGNLHLLVYPQDRPCPGKKESYSGYLEQRTLPGPTDGEWLDGDAKRFDSLRIWDWRHADDAIKVFIYESDAAEGFDPVSVGDHDPLFCATVRRTETLQNLQTYSDESRPAKKNALESCANAGITWHQGVWSGELREGIPSIFIQFETIE